MAALMIVVVLRAQTIVYILSPTPELLINLSETFHIHMILGLLVMDLLLISDWLLYIPLFIALFIVLRRTDGRYMAIAFQTALVASVVHFASNTAMHLLTLNGSFFAATNVWEQAATLAYSSSMMSIDISATSYISHMLASFAALIISTVMLRSHLFGDTVAYTGIVGNLLAFGIFIPVIGIWFSVLASTFLGVWYLLIGWQLLWLASNPYIDYGPQQFRLFVQ